MLDKSTEAQSRSPGGHVITASADTASRHFRNAGQSPGRSTFNIDTLTLHDDEKPR